MARNVFVVPQRAVTELQGYYQMVVVDSDKKAHLKTVTVADQIGSEWIIERGCKRVTKSWSRACKRWGRKTTK